MIRCYLMMTAALLMAGCSGAGAQLGDSTFASAGAADASTMEATATAKRYRLPTAGSAIDTGGAIIRIEAPMEDVLREVQRFDNYKNIFPRIKDTRVVSRKGETTDVYMRAPVLNDSTAIWAVTRFSKPKPWSENGKQITSRFVKGNLKAWRGVWKLQPISDNVTVLRLELFLDVKLPVPDEWITPDIMWACDKAVTAIRDTAEKGESTVKDD
jgi:ribosome-associated toxin RatA of RatAB toxin-antitoxin module